MAKLGILIEPGAARVMYAYGVLKALPWLLPKILVAGGNSSGAIAATAVAMNDVDVIYRIFHAIAKERDFLSFTRVFKGQRPGDMSRLEEIGRRVINAERLKNSNKVAFAGYYDLQDKRIIYERIRANNAFALIKRTCANPFLSAPIDGRYVDGGVYDYLPIEQFDGRNPAWKAEKVVVIGYNTLEVRLPVPFRTWTRRHLEQFPSLRATTYIKERYRAAMTEIREHHDRYFYIGPTYWPVLPFNPFADSPRVLEKLTERGDHNAQKLELELRRWLKE